MAKIKLIADTDVLIDYFNFGLFREVFERPDVHVFYSIVTQKELLTKTGLKNSERENIQKVLRRFRLIPLNPRIVDKYSRLRYLHPRQAKEDTLIAATAIVYRLPLFTRNLRHYRVFSDLKLFF